MAAADGAHQGMGKNRHPTAAVAGHRTTGTHHLDQHSLVMGQMFCQLCQYFQKITIFIRMLNSCSSLSATSAFQGLACIDIP
jgi:hypothetical protein